METAAATRYRAVFTRLGALCKRLDAAPWHERDALRAEIRQAEAELDAAQADYAPERPDLFGRLHDNGGD